MTRYWEGEKETESSWGRTMNSGPHSHRTRFYVPHTQTNVRALECRVYGRGGISVSPPRQDGDNIIPGPDGYRVSALLEPRSRHK